MKSYPVFAILAIDGMSERTAARHFGVSRQSVRKMLQFSVPPGYRRTAPVRRPKLDEFTGPIEQWLGDDRRHGYLEQRCRERQSDVLRGHLESIAKRLYRDLEAMTALAGAPFAGWELTSAISEVELRQPSWAPSGVRHALSSFDVHLKALDTSHDRRAPVPGSRPASVVRSYRAAALAMTALVSMRANSAPMHWCTRCPNAAYLGPLRAMSSRSGSPNAVSSRFYEFGDHPSVAEHHDAGVRATDGRSLDGGEERAVGAVVTHRRAARSASRREC